MRIIGGFVLTLFLCFSVQARDEEWSSLLHQLYSPDFTETTESTLNFERVTLRLGALVLAEKIQALLARGHYELGLHLAITAFVFNVEVERDDLQVFWLQFLAKHFRLYAGKTSNFNRLDNYESDFCLDLFYHDLPWLRFHGMLHPPSLGSYIMVLIPQRAEDLRALNYFYGRYHAQFENQEVAPNIIHGFTSGVLVALGDVMGQTSEAQTALHRQEHLLDSFLWVGPEASEFERRTYIHHPLGPEIAARSGQIKWPGFLRRLFISSDPILSRVQITNLPENYRKVLESTFRYRAIPAPHR